MLYQQIASSGVRALEWAVDLKIAKYTRKDAVEPDRDNKLRTVTQAIEERGLVGTVDEPKEYVKATLPMCWGIFNDAGRPDEEPPLVYFGGRTGQTVFGLGGSTRHVVGVAGSTSTGSRSITPYLVGHLLHGLGTPIEGWNAYPPRQDTDDDLCHALALATDHLKGPVQNLEFFAKTLTTGTFLDRQGGTTTVRIALLATPLFVALASPYPEDLDSY